LEGSLVILLFSDNLSLSSLHSAQRLELPEHELSTPVLETQSADSLRMIMVVVTEARTVEAMTKVEPVVTMEAITRVETAVTLEVATEAITKVAPVVTTEAMTRVKPVVTTEAMTRVGTAVTMQVIMGAMIRVVATATMEATTVGYVDF
jgi:hypothetical protein